MLDWWIQLNNFIYVVMGAIVGAFVLLIRKIFTNEKQLELLKAEIKQRNESRKEYDDNLSRELAENRNNIDKQLAEIRHDIKNLLAGNYSINRLVQFKEEDK